MKVVFSPLSESDLEDIGDFIAADNPHRAVSFIREMRERCQKIAATPDAAPLREDIMPNVRMVVHGNYLIFYCIVEQDVRIERILHSARNIRALLA
ncbi:plasmid stabilization protein [Terasakiella brassicae]|uniref:Plasmid stabilization protein n=1 Tax=Terasakiella brassicae TaxID=1634917 RepID=A0A917CAN4_9PROT|nr:type II toxin-antitoxin system RelE/ParE family toxin [Terasakiella brassicae]GGF76857.1 plasmid stabilization protein [Terasakiella brassicae]